MLVHAKPAHFAFAFLSNIPRKRKKSTFWLQKNYEKNMQISNSKFIVLYLIYFHFNV